MRLRSSRAARQRELTIERALWVGGDDSGGEAEGEAEHEGVIEVGPLTAATLHRAELSNASIPPSATHHLPCRSAHRARARSWRFRRRRLHRDGGGLRRGERKGSV